MERTRRPAKLKDVDGANVSPTCIRVPAPHSNSANHSFLRTDSDDESAANGNRRGVPEVFFAGSSSSCDENAASDPDEITVDEQLELAKGRIKELETWLDVREKELRSTQDKMRKLAVSGRRSRRHARSGDLFRRNDVPSRDAEQDIGSATEDAFLDEFMLLTVLRISDHESEATANSLRDDRNQSVIPLYMRRLEGEIFAIGPKGATIGSEKHCGVHLPPETGMSETHARIRWKDKERVFVVESEMKHDAKCYVYTGMPRNSDDLRDQNNFIHSNNFSLQNGSIFQTGLIIWKVSKIPQRQLLISQLFYTVRQRDLHKLHFLKVCVTSWNDNLKNSSVSSQDKTANVIDFNVEENIDYQIVDTTGEFGSRLSCDRFSLTAGDEDASTMWSEQKGKFCLLHVAVDYTYLPIVKFLLNNGALVNKQCGLGKFAPLHIAVRHNNCDIVNELLKFGADLELTDAWHNLPISIAVSYNARKLLLSSMMLCSAAESGDLPEVERIINTIKVSPNVKGLSHKSPLHLASMNGHINVVSFLLDNRADINMVGGSRRRTALHYASLSDHAQVARMLVAYGADQNVIDLHGYTALNLSNGGEMCRILHEGPLSVCLATQAGDINEVRRLLEGDSSGPRRRSSVMKPSARKLSRTASERKVSRQMAISSLGLSTAIDQRNEQGHAPLHLASTAGNIDMVKLLVSFGASVDLPGGLDKWTPLFYAALAGHADVVGFLLSIGADSERVDAQGLMAIDHVEKNIEDLQQKLDRRKPQLSENDSMDDNTNSTQNLMPPQLHRQSSDTSLPGSEHQSWTRKQLARQQQVLLVLQSGMQRLLQALEQDDIVSFRDALTSRSNIDIDAPLTKHTNTTALQYASSSGMIEFVEALLEHGADPFLPNSQSCLPIHTAARYGHSEVVLAFVTRGVDINVRSKAQLSTPLHHAAASDREECVQVLLQNGADPTLLDHEGESPFDVANVFEVLSLLAEGKNRLYVAIVRGDMKQIRSLVEVEGIGVDIVFKQNLTPLHIACSETKLDVAEYLIDKGANVNAQGGSESCTPLHIATRGSSTQLAQILIEKGAKLSIMNAAGKTAFEEATTNAMRKILVSAQSMRQAPPTDTKDNNADRNGNRSQQEQNCRICFDKPINTIILPCGHQAFCMDCACQLEVCAFDRRSIAQIVPVYYAGASS